MNSRITKHKLDSLDRNRIFNFIQKYDNQDNKRFGDYAILYKNFITEYPEYKDNVTYSCFMHYVKYPAERAIQLHNNSIFKDTFNTFMKELSSNKYYSFKQEYDAFIKKIEPMNLNISICYSNYCRKRQSYFDSHNN